MANNKIDALKVGETFFDITLPTDAAIIISTISVTGSAAFSEATVTQTLSASGVTTSTVTISTATDECIAITSSSDRLVFGDGTVPTCIYGSDDHPLYYARGASGTMSAIALTSDLGTQVTYTYSSGILNITTK